MPATLGIVGLDQHELTSVRTLVDLLRSTDPLIAELAREAIAYVEDLSRRSVSEPIDSSARGTLRTPTTPFPSRPRGAIRRNGLA